MSMKKHHGVIVYSCDGPGCEFKTDTGAKSFFTALNIIKGRGWEISHMQIGKTARAWRHFCGIRCEKAAVDKAREADQGAA